MENYIGDSQNLNTLLPRIHIPCIADVNFIYKEWKLFLLKPENLEKSLGKQLINFRIGGKNNDIQWETKCNYITTTIQNFLHWLDLENINSNVTENKKIKLDLTNPLHKYDPGRYWCYADYKYMSTMFHQNFLSNINWKHFGFDEKDGKDTTLWIGSKGATTVCHYDTYGYNIVIQVSGKKRWILFPPSDTDKLYLTRIPYEESSVFSKVNIKDPETELHPKFLKSSPYVIELCEGEMLYVPEKWWHYVENMETSVSINMWVPVPNDKTTRLNEAVTRLMVGNFLSNQGNNNPYINSDMLINPTERKEDVLNKEQSLQYLNQSLKEIKTHHGDCEKTVDVKSCGNIKKIELKPLPKYTVSTVGRIYKIWNNLTDKNQNFEEKQFVNFSNLDFLEVLMHPNVIKEVSKQLLIKYNK